MNDQSGRLMLKHSDLRVGEMTREVVGLTPTDIMQLVARGYQATYGKRVFTTHIDPKVNPLIAIVVVDGQVPPTDSRVLMGTSNECEPDSRPRA